MEEIARNVDEGKRVFRRVKSQTSDSLLIPIPMKVRRSVIRVQGIFDDEGNLKPGVYEIRFYKEGQDSLHIRLNRIKAEGRR